MDTQEKLVRQTLVNFLFYIFPFKEDQSLLYFEKIYVLSISPLDMINYLHFSLQIN